MSGIYLTFPQRLASIGKLEWSLSGSTIGSGQNVYGQPSRARTDGGGFWVCAWNSVFLHSFDQHRAWDAINGLIGDGVTPIIIPGSNILAPWPLDGQGNPIRSVGDVFFDDGTTFDDGTGFYQPVIRIEAAGSASLRDRTLAINPLQCGPLRGGEPFSIVHPIAGKHRYRIVGIDLDAGTISVDPGFRDDVSIGDELDFENPGSLMTLADPAAMPHAIEAPHTSSTQAMFIEYDPS